ncbi:hypothetical protein BKA62DRAFT_675380 [Auriculariales sp. MPI-PUGE-AT-0066]|nr:hypothetical protein BKA62DRAFT_675380 [Auriculariales sp. MPI-PUGE-AT-0066]
MEPDSSVDLLARLAIQVGHLRQEVAVQQQQLDAARQEQSNLKNEINAVRLAQAAWLIRRDSRARSNYSVSGLLTQAQGKLEAFSALRADVKSGKKELELLKKVLEQSSSKRESGVTWILDRRQHTQLASLPDLLYRWGNAVSNISNIPTQSLR